VLKRAATGSYPEQDEFNPHYLLFILFVLDSFYFILPSTPTASTQVFSSGFPVDDDDDKEKSIGTAVSNRLAAPAVMTVG
jgi:hypothetical protein